MRVDVAIVGAGPAGCLAGKTLAERGLDVVIVEEHGEVGSPACCAGVVGKTGLRELGIEPGEWVLNKLRGVVLYPPSNEPIELTRGRVEALVIDRGAFDRGLARGAAEAGATFLLKAKCVDIKLGREPSIKLRGVTEAEVKTRLIIGADGPTSIVARKAGLLKIPSYIGGAQLETLAEAQADWVELHFGRSIAPGFFAWVVPAGNIRRVGLGTTQGSPLKKLLPFARGRGISGKILSFCTGPIPAPLSRKLYADRVMLIGDAAGQVKPLTGGGIYIGLSCAKLAAEVAERSLGEEPTEKMLRGYERAVMKKFGREFELGIRARRVFERMTDEDLNSMLGLLAKDEVRNLVTKNFDFDHHYKILRALLSKAPQLLRSLGLKRALKYSRLLLEP